MSSDFWNDKRIMITGITGFAGSWLAEKLLGKDGVRVFGLKRESSSLDNVKHLKGKMTLLNGDVLNEDSLIDALKESEPDIVFHLAAQALAKIGYDEPFKTFSLNFTGTMNLMDAIRRYDSKIIKIHFASSSNVYGYVKPEEIPVNEKQEIKPFEMYGISKASADSLCRSYSNAYGMPIVVTRAFHHEGPRCNKDVIGMEIVQQISNAIKGLTKTLSFGNIDVTRDFSDVRDIVNGYLLAVERGSNGEVYNLCSGKGYEIRDLINEIINEFRLDGMRIETDPKKLRKKDIPIMVGDNSKAKKELGWKIEREFKNTLVELINHNVKTI
ncbi:MAG: GDP-mannose 4,6-dehydratase [Candidatus Aenigmarchaeota archaeon]|nr:GDP-mannose 4,6-dehydratase [Candidatus Aenigmarchaeota archaeon]